MFTFKILVFSLRDQSIEGNVVETYLVRNVTSYLKRNVTKAGCRRCKDSFISFLHDTKMGHLLQNTNNTKSASLVKYPTVATLWQHCGNTVAESLRP